jgi:hypothetical protein
MTFGDDGNGVSHHSPLLLTPFALPRSCRHFPLISHSSIHPANHLTIQPFIHQSINPYNPSIHPPAATPKHARFAKNPRRSRALIYCIGISKLRHGAKREHPALCALPSATPIPLQFDSNCHASLLTFHALQLNPGSTKKKKKRKN